LTMKRIFWGDDLSDNSEGALEPLASFTTNPAGSAIVNAVDPIRQIVRNTVQAQRRYLVIVEGNADHLGRPVQAQVQ
jgi:hypothetical protein